MVVGPGVDHADDQPAHELLARELLLLLLHALLLHALPMREAADVVAREPALAAQFLQGPGAGGFGGHAVCSLDLWVQ
ncbi:hypothetical protein [Variovorax beijingensis]|uniref:hypothetical protein n=1 Tax=Variovorax beijingensis TaxID=2496117 RepID=UPI001CB9D1A1|nr:hypothetical protein [Variovorax beijingensis]